VALALVGQLVTTHKHLDAIIKGLTSQYNPAFAIIESNFPKCLDTYHLLQRIV